MSTCTPVTPPGSGVTETLYAHVTVAPGNCACLLGGSAALAWSDPLGYWAGTMLDLCDASLSWTVRLRWVVDNVFTLYLSRSDECFSVNCTATATSTSPVAITFDKTNIPDGCCTGSIGSKQRNAVVVQIGETAPTAPVPPASHPVPHVGDVPSIQRHCITQAASSADGTDNSTCSGAPTTWTLYAPTGSIGTPLARVGVRGGGLVLGVPPDPDALGLAALDLAATSALIPAEGETCYLYAGGFDFSSLEDTDRDLTHVKAYLSIYSDSPNVQCTGLQLCTNSGGTLTLIGEDLSDMVATDLTGDWHAVSIDPASNLPATLWGLLSLPYSDPAVMQAAIDAIRAAGIGIAAKFANTGTDAANVYLDYAEQGACVQRTYPACKFGDNAVTQPAGTADGDTLCDCATTPWIFPGSVIANDENENNSAQANLLSDTESCTLLSSHHDFGLPDGCTLTKIWFRVVLKASVEDSIVCELAQLTDGSTLLGDDQSESAFDEAIPTDWTQYMIGFAVPLWGSTAEDLAAVINEIGFGLALRFRNNGAAPATVYVNFIEGGYCYA